MNRYLLTALSVAGGILSGLAWTEWCPGLLLLLAFAPYFIIENHIYLNPRKFSMNSYFTFLLPGFVIFNTIALSWVRAANIPAAIAVITEMSFLMSFVLWLAHVIRVKAGNTAGYTALITFWLAFEHLSLHSPYLSPWINLGNGLAKDILFIQWYEATGVAGGTLWILLSNLFLTLLITKNPGKRRIRIIYAAIWVAVIIIPAVLSATRYLTIEKPDYRASEVVIIQPDIDPFSEKYTIPFEDQLNRALIMARNNISDETDWLILPETIVDDPVNEADAANDKYILALRDFAVKHKGLNIIAGLVSYRVYPDAVKAPTRSARKTNLSEYYADHYNSAFNIDASDDPSIYHKSRLVPGIEMQFSAILGKLTDKILPDMGGTIWGYGTQKTRTCFTHSVTGQKVAPVICYESVFGNFVADYVREGAEALFVITNDGWWKNTNGYFQHLTYSSLRAIETRRPVARCANTGISCLIDIRGKRIQETEWWTKSVLKGTIISGTKTTFYVRTGDYIYVMSSVISIMILIYTFLYELKREKNNGLK